MVTGLADRRKAVAGQLPDAFAPFIGCGGADHPGEVRALQTGKCAGQHQGLFHVGMIAGHQATVLCALFPQQPGQPAGVDASEGDHATLAQIVVQRLLAAPVAGEARTVPHHQAAGVDAGCFLVAPVVPTLPMWG